jgi:hypothetical protein
MLRTCIFCKHLYILSLATEAASTEFQSVSHVHSKCRLITGSRMSLKRTCFAGQAYEIPSKYSLIASLHGA